MGDWLAILEKAAGQYYLNESLNPFGSNDPYDYINAGASTGYALPLLTGNGTDADDLWCTSLESTRAALVAVFANPNAVHKLVVAGTSSSTGTGYLGRGLRPNHVYSVVNYDSSTDRITLFNPWGSNPTFVMPTGYRGNLGRDGFFTTSLSRFDETFSDIVYEL